MAHEAHALPIAEFRSLLEPALAAHGFTHDGKGRFTARDAGTARHIVVTRHAGLSRFSNFRVDFEVEILDGERILRKRRLEGDQILPAGRTSARDWGTMRPGIWEVRNAGEVPRVVGNMMRFVEDYGLVFLNAGTI